MCVSVCLCVHEYVCVCVAPVCACVFVCELADVTGPHGFTPLTRQ